MPLLCISQSTAQKQVNTLDGPLCQEHQGERGRNDWVQKYRVLHGRHRLQCRTAEGILMLVQCQFLHPTFFALAACITPSARNHRAWIWEHNSKETR